MQSQSSVDAGEPTASLDAGALAAEAEVTEVYNPVARARTGVRVLLTRQIALQGLTFLGGVVIARVLGPAQFGLFAIATLLVSVVGNFGDFGLAPSLIQREEEIGTRELRIGFTVQQVITTSIVVLLFLAAPTLVRLYPKAPEGTAWLVRALALSLYLASWRSICALQLERHLQYSRLAWVDIAETVTYYAVAITLALQGRAVWSLVWATLARGLVGAVLAFWAAPWSIGFAYDHAIARKMLRFGVPFQMQGLVNQANGWITWFLVGRFLGPTAVGLLTWASSNGRKPLILADNVVRVAFPLFSRLQSDPDRLAETLARMITLVLLPAGLWFVIIAAAGDRLVAEVYSNAWTAGVPALLLYAGTLIVDSVAWPVVCALNSSGSVGASVRYYTVNSIASTVFAVILIPLIGLIAVPVAMLLASFVSLPVLLGRLGFRLGARVMRPQAWVAVPISVSMGFGVALSRLMRHGLETTIMLVVLATAVYAAAALVAGPRWIRVDARRAMRMVQQRLLASAIGVITGRPGTPTHTV